MATWRPSGRSAADRGLPVGARQPEVETDGEQQPAASKAPRRQVSRTFPSAGFTTMATQPGRRRKVSFINQTLAAQ